MKNELELFREIWERENAKTMKLLESLPGDQYDFRPDADGRSLGELAWHLAEGEGYGTFAIEQGGFVRGEKPPGIERPRKVEDLAPAYARIHRDAVARVANLKPEDLDRSIDSFSGAPTTIREVLWGFMLLHGIHHRGQLTLLARQAGGKPVSPFGPTRETSPLRKSA